MTIPKGASGSVVPLASLQIARQPLTSSRCEAQQESGVAVGHTVSELWASTSGEFGALLSMGCAEDSAS